LFIDAMQASCDVQDEPIPAQHQWYLSKELIMNSNQVKGAAKDIGGKIQEEAGKLTGSTETQAKGLKNQVEGKVQQKVGNMQEAVKDANNQAVKNGNKQ
jgi:uncharacterized protein YjbJ (UPF0337 family)